MHSLVLINDPHVRIYWLPRTARVIFGTHRIADAAALGTAAGRAPLIILIASFPFEGSPTLPRRASLALPIAALPHMCFPITALSRATITNFTGEFLNVRL